MNTLFARIHMQSDERISLKEVNFHLNVGYLKSQIAKIINCDANSFELIYHGRTLDDEQTLRGLIRPQSIVHCFSKVTVPKPYEPRKDIDFMKALEFFTITSNVQISVNSRVNILQKILAEYPELRRNLGAQALLRDSVLFSALYVAETMRNVAQHYPIIIEAAPFIVDTIKKELLRVSATNATKDTTQESTTSSEEENSVSASTSGARRTERLRRFANIAGQSGRPSTGEHPVISRQHLQAALAGINVGSTSSNNSLANISQTSTAAAVAANPVPTTPSDESPSDERFRHQLQAALRAMSSRIDRYNTGPQNMETDTETTTMSTSSTNSDPNDGDIPVLYRQHQYAQQLRTMMQMGFIDFDENVNLLNITDGNIEMAINLLMGTMN